MILKQILEALAKELLELVNAELVVLGLEDSALARSMKVVPTLTGFQFWANDYTKYVISGRKRFAKKIPISALIPWIKKKGFSYKGSINGLAFAIQQSIYVNGIEGRDIFKVVGDKEAEIETKIWAGIDAEVTRIINDHARLSQTA